MVVEPVETSIRKIKKRPISKIAFLNFSYRGFYHHEGIKTLLIYLENILGQFLKKKKFLQRGQILDQK